MNKIIEIQGNQCVLKFNTSIFIGFTALIMLFSCIFPTFYENLHNFWTKIFFKIKFGDLVSKYLLFKPWKCEMKILISGWVNAISLGGCFFLGHPVQFHYITTLRVKFDWHFINDILELDILILPSLTYPSNQTVSIGLLFRKIRMCFLF